MWCALDLESVALYLRSLYHYDCCVMLIHCPLAREQGSGERGMFLCDDEFPLYSGAFTHLPYVVFLPYYDSGPFIASGNSVREPVVVVLTTRFYTSPTFYFM